MSWINYRNNFGIIFSDGNKIRLTLSFVIMVGFILRFRGMSDGNLWADELLRISWYNSDLENAISGPNHVSLSRFFMWILYFFIPNDIFWIRFPLIIFSTMTIAITYFICNEISNSKCGIIASLIIAISPLSIRYSGEISSYPVLEFFTATAILSSIHYKNYDAKYSYYVIIFSSLILSSNPLTFGVAISCILYLWNNEFNKYQETDSWKKIKKLILSKYFRNSLWPISLCIYITNTTILNGEINSSGDQINYQYFLQILVFWNKEAILIMKLIMPFILIMLPFTIFEAYNKNNLDISLIIICLIFSLGIIVFPSYLFGSSIQGRYLIQLCPIIAIIIAVNLEILVEKIDSKLNITDNIKTIFNLLFMSFVIFILISSFSIIKESQPKPEYINVIADLSDVDDKLIIASPDNIYWETTSILNSREILNITHSEWAFKDLNIHDCSLNNDEQGIYLIVAEKHNEDIKREIEGILLQEWVIINSRHYYQTSWYELSPTDLWRNNCNE